MHLSPFRFPNTAMNAQRPVFRSPIWWCSIAFCVALLLFVRSRPSSEPDERLTVFSGPTMGTTYTVKLVDLPSSADAQRLEEEIRRELELVDRLMSTYRADSELSQLNRFEGTGWFEVSPETAAVIHQAVCIGRLTQGAFDVTVGPLVNLWEFGPDGGAHRVPSAEEIGLVKGRVGPGKIEVRLSPPAVRKRREDVYVDLSGIAKGFAVDQLARHLENRRIENYMVEVGGELKARGHNHRDQPWQVAVESPLAGTRAIERIVPLGDRAMATSGDYRNYFEKDGLRYCHIIDPRSARPVSHRLASVTVLAPSCTRADALATGLFVLGPEAAYNLALKEKLPVLLLVKTAAGFSEKSTPDFEQAPP